MLCSVLPKSGESTLPPIAFSTPPHCKGGGGEKTQEAIPGKGTLSLVLPMPKYPSTTPLSVASGCGLAVSAPSNRRSLKTSPPKSWQTQASHSADVTEGLHGAATRNSLLSLPGLWRDPGAGKLALHTCRSQARAPRSFLSCQF